MATQESGFKKNLESAIKAKLDQALKDHEKAMAEKEQELKKMADEKSKAEQER